MEADGSHLKRYDQKWLHRRRVLQGMALGGGLTAATLAGCTDQAATPRSTTGDEQPKSGGTLRFPAFGSGAPYERGLDPHVLQASYAGRALLFYQTLVRANPRTLAVEPELAQKWEQPSATELVFTMQPGVKWHNKPPANGRELTVNDVVFSLERIRTPDPRFISRTLLDSVDKIEPVDSSRVRLTLKLEDTTALPKLTGFPMAILAPEVVERAGGKFLDPETAVGTGPFILEAKSDISVAHVRNPAYWKPGLPYLDRVLTPMFADDQARWAAFLGGQIDLVYPPGSVGHKYSAERGRFLLEQKYRAEWFADPGLQGIWANVRRKPFDDPRVYRAVRLLIDHEEAIKAEIEVTYGRGYHSQAFPAALAEWDFSQEEYVTKFLEWRQPKDEAVKVALDLLSAAGFSREQPLTFTISTYESASRRIQAELQHAQLRRLGQGVVQPDLRTLDTATLDQLFARRDFQYGTRGAPAPAAEPDAYLRTLFYTDGGRNYAQWSDPRVDQMIDKQRGMLDTAQRKALIKEILRYLVDHAPTTLWGGRYSLTATQPKVKGWAPEGDPWVFGFQYEQVWLEG